MGTARRFYWRRACGRMRRVPAGARRIKNRYGSTLQLLSHVQVWYVEKETRDLVRIQQCEPLESFNKSQSDYFLSTGMAVVSEVTEIALPEREVSEPMFRLILLTAQEIERTGEWTLPLSYFAFWTVRLGGWLARVDRCDNCGTAFGTRAAYFASWEPGLLCDKCRRSGMLALHAPARELAGRFTGERLDRIALGEPLKS